MARILIHPARYENVSQAVARCFELFPLEIRGRRVLIKPNVLRASRPEEGITTHPAVLRAVVDQVESMGPASLVVGDNPGLVNYGANQEAFRATGLMEAAKGYYRNIGDDSVRLDFDPSFVPSVTLSRAIWDADVIISLPKFKTHGLTVVSGCIKNSYGFLPGAQKAALHRIAGSAERFHELIVSIFKLKIPDLFIVDAVLGMEGNGPASPDLRDIGLILASDSAVALDAAISTMMGCDPGSLPFLAKAQAEGLGCHDLSQAQIIGEFKVIPGFKLPPLSGEGNLKNEHIQGLIKSRSLFRPLAHRDQCTGCGTCVDQCPVSALSMDSDGIPVVDREACIACFCCQEICPEKAIVLQ
ncbi:MAG TPA: DUF362 domain-containing protein [Deltaproteobacteria bacterium]|nr:DUF362 domain-containing protein [Deltaproteobacteria bacterium]HOI06699.1 DUF362 domain-containing protein [Deltaproteobacteria bacterium]